MHHCKIGECDSTCEKLDNVEGHHKQPHGDVGGGQGDQEIILHLPQWSILENGNDHEDVPRRRSFYIKYRELTHPMIVIKIMMR